MKNWSIFLLAVLAMPLSSCTQSADLRFRISVTIDDKGESRTFSRVWRFQLNEAPVPLAAPYSGQFTGEAVAMELAGRPTLYALTVSSARGGSLATLPEILFNPLVSGSVRRNDRIAMVRAISNMRGESRDLRCEPPEATICPRFVYLEDKNDPSTIHVVNPDDLPDIYKGAKIKRISVTIVNEKPEDSGVLVPAFQYSARLSRWYRSLESNDPRNLRPEAFREGM